MIYSTDKNFMIESFGYRVGSCHPNADIQIGRGDVNADIVVVQPHPKMPDRDSITGALKRFGMLDASYRATIMMVDYKQSPPPDVIEVYQQLGKEIPPQYPDLIRQAQRKEKPKTQEEINRYYLKELIEMINPLIVVACGLEVTALLQNKKLRSFKSYAGRKFTVSDLTKPVFYATLNPMEYGFARAPAELKTQGKREWEKLSKLYIQLKEKQEKERWE